jgi:N-acetyl-beta-hexosaminidase
VGSYTPDTIYTQEDVTAIVQYAEARGIIVIPGA